MNDGLEAVLTEALAPPMANGEVIFEAPWQGRVFGMARALAAAGVYEWDEFRACLIAEIAAWDRAPDGPFVYYDHFLRALESVLAQRNLLLPGALRQRVDVLAARPHGHDHSHPHDDHHPHDAHHDHHSDDEHHAHK